MVVARNSFSSYRKWTILTKSKKRNGESLSAFGDSLVIVKDEDILKVHIHTLKPGDVLNVGQQYGEFVHLKIENMTIQHNESAEILNGVSHQEGECYCGEYHARM